MANCWWPCCGPVPVGVIIARKYGASASSTLSWAFRREGGTVSPSGGDLGFIAAPAGWGIDVRSSDGAVFVGGESDVNRDVAWMLNASGVIQWTLNRLNGYSNVRAVCFSQDGNSVYVLYSQVVIGSGGRLAKLSASDGSSTWDVSVGTITNDIQKIIEASNGDVYMVLNKTHARRYAGIDGSVVWSAMDATLIGSQPATMRGVAEDAASGDLFWVSDGSSGGSDPFLLHTDYNGVILSAHPQGGYFNSFPHDIAVGSDGKLIIVGGGIKATSADTNLYSLTRWSRTTPGTIPNEIDFSLDWGVLTSDYPDGKPHRVVLDGSDRIFSCSAVQTTGSDRYFANAYADGAETWELDWGDQLTRDVAVSSGGNAHIAGDGV